MTRTQKAKRKILTLPKKTQVLDNSKQIALNNGLTSFTTGLVGITGKQLSSTDGIILNTRYGLSVSLDRSMLEASYTTFGLVQTFIDQPIDDAYRGGIKITASDELDEDNIQDLNTYIKQHNIIAEIKDLRRWARLYGGSGMILDVEGQDPEEPFSIDSIDKNSEFRFYAADLWQLNQVINQPHGENVPFQPEFEGERPFLMLGVPINRDRVAKTINKKAPFRLRSQLRGWGMSELERLVRDLNNFQKAENVIYELLDESKITVHKSTGFNSALISSTSEAQILKRFQIAEQAKNILNAIVIDSDDDVQQMQVDFTGVALMMPELRKGIASALRMPMTKIFGQSAAGFNAGEDDLENYNSMIESEIRGHDDHVILWMLKIISKKLFDFVPENLDFEYKPLRILNAEQEESVKDKKFARGERMVELGRWTDDEFDDYVKTNNLL